MDTITLRAVRQANIFAAKPQGKPLSTTGAAFKKVLDNTNSPSVSKNASGNIDIDSLTSEEYYKYFGHPAGGKNSYLPIAEQSEQVKQAWIKTMDTLNEEEQYMAKIGIIKAFATGKNDLSQMFFPSNTFNTFLSSEYDALLQNPMAYQSVTGKMDLLTFWQMMLERFEKQYIDEMSKKGNSLARMIKDARFIASLS